MSPLRIIYIQMDYLGIIEFGLFYVSVSYRNLRFVKSVDYWC